MSVVVHRRGWRSAAISVVACIGLAMPSIACAEDGERATYRGRRVIDALAQLRGEGLPIILSSALVPSTLVVKKEPRARTPRQIAVDILAPHGLTLTEGPGGTWLVVKKPRIEADRRGGERVVYSGHPLLLVYGIRAAF